MNDHRVVDTITTESKHGGFLFRYLPKKTAQYFVRFDGKVVTKANGTQVTCEPGESRTVRVRGPGMMILRACSDRETERVARAVFSEVFAPRGSGRG
jgi:hypothetical protein